MTKRCTPSQTDVIFVVMDALVRIYEDDLSATRNVTAIPWPYPLGSNLTPASSISSVRTDGNRSARKYCKDLNLPVSLRPRLVTVGRCHGILERVAHVLASRKDKGCVDLPLPSCAIAVQSVPTTASTNVDSVVNGNVQVHIAKHMKVCKMEELGESVVWREAIGLVAIKIFLEAHRDVFDLEEQGETVMMRLKSTTHSTDQNRRAAANSLSSITNSGVWRRSGRVHWDHKCRLLVHLEGFTQVRVRPLGLPGAMAHSKNSSKKSTPLHVWKAFARCRCQSPAQCWTTFGIAHDWHR